MKWHQFRMDDKSHARIKQLAKESGLPMWRVCKIAVAHLGAVGIHPQMAQKAAQGTRSRD
jgi:hypothetical protein